MFSLATHIHSRRGFSIPELLVVVAAISLLAAVALAALTRARDKAMVTRTRADIAELKKIVETYRTQNAGEPPHLHDGTIGYETTWSLGYIKAWPKTAWLTNYFFTHSGAQSAPTTSDYYYIGLTMPPVMATLYDQMYDDGSSSTGMFQSYTGPPAHYGEYLFTYPGSGHNGH